MMGRFASILEQNAFRWCWTSCTQVVVVLASLGKIILDGTERAGRLWVVLWLVWAKYFFSILDELLHSGLNLYCSVSLIPSLISSVIRKVSLCPVDAGGVRHVYLVCSVFGRCAPGQSICIPGTWPVL